MKAPLFVKLVLLSLVFSCATIALARCGDTWSGYSEFSTGRCADTAASRPSELVKTVIWSSVYWLDGYTRNNVAVDEKGELGRAGFFTHACTACWPRFDQPYFEEVGQIATWIQKTYRASINLSTNACSTNFLPSDDHRNGHICPYPGRCNGIADYINYPSTGCIIGFVFGGPCTRSMEFQSRCNEPTGYEQETCSCPDGTSMSPIVIDVDRSGFSMSDAAGGVVFNMLNDGVPLAVSWTSSGSTNAFLVLDRNGNGTIDSGAELFGDITPQPASAAPNGFIALAEYDKSAQGGNGNGRVDSGDAIFSQLRLWQDENHNGASEANELHPPAQLGIGGVDLDYKESKTTDSYGNRFRYRAKVYDLQGAQAGKWAWDVFLTVQ